MLLKINITCLICFVFVTSLCSWSQAEIFTATSDVECLLHTHKKIVEDMKHYIKAEEERLEKLTKRLNRYTMEHEKAMEDIPSYLGNPINAFTLIKRLTKDLEFLRQYVQFITDNNNITKNHEGMRYPTLEDLSGTAEALTRLQETYELDVHELSEGKLNGVVYSNPMTAEDCFEIGHNLYINSDYKNTLPWMTEALRKNKVENESYHFDEADIFEYISMSHYRLGDLKSASEWIEKIKESDLSTKHSQAAANILIYKKKLADEMTKKSYMKIEEELTTEQTMSEIHLQSLEEEYKDYKILCRGQMDVPAIIAKRLKCRYLTENHPFLRLAPIKMEYLYLQPDVVMFHDVMSDAEIEFIQNAAKPRFIRASIQSADTGTLIPVKYRISKSAWLEDWESPVVARVSQRVADMTGLSMATAESLQVVNYGIGGHYIPHYDFTTKNDVSQNDYNGKRIATVLFYMSDVEQGGATVFTKLGLSVFPKKGAAAFWLNLHASGEGDLATRHAACPVLRGSKWVSNKWLHEHTQEFLRPCNLEYQEEGVLRELPKPVLKTTH